MYETRVDICASLNSLQTECWFGVHAIKIKSKVKLVLSDKCNYFATFFYAFKLEISCIKHCNIKTCASLVLLIMTIHLSLRKLIRSHYDDGKSGLEIYQAFNKTVSKSTINLWLRILKSKNTIEAVKPTGRPRSVRTKKLIRIVKKKVKNRKNPKLVRFIAREVDCTQTTIRRVIHNDLSFRTYSRVKVQALTNSHIQQRMRFGGWIRRNLPREDCKQIRFSDEKIVNGDSQVNSKNDVIDAENRYEANINRRVIPTKVNLSQVMI